MATKEQTATPKLQRVSDRLRSDDLSRAFLGGSTALLAPLRASRYFLCTHRQPLIGPPHRGALRGQEAPADGGVEVIRYEIRPTPAP